MYLVRDDAISTSWHELLVKKGKSLKDLVREEAAIYSNKSLPVAYKEFPDESGVAEILRDFNRLHGGQYTPTTSSQEGVLFFNAEDAYKASNLLTVEDFIPFE